MWVNALIHLQLFGFSLSYIQTKSNTQIIVFDSIELSVYFVLSNCLFVYINNESIVIYSHKMLMQSIFIFCHGSRDVRTRKK